MIYVAPPFGTYFRPKHAIPVLGSFTVEPRPGRTGQVLRTVRPTNGGWLNAIGLRNPGVVSLDYRPGVVCSLAGIADGDWEKLHEWMRLLDWPTYLLELNLSCPNVAEYGHPRRATLEDFAKLPNATISAKLPPNEVEALALTELCLESGIRLIHLSNTLPSPRGGISGAQLRAVNLPIVDSVARSYPTAKIIAGGGIYTVEHARQYRDAGAKHLSLGTVFMNPIRGWRLYRRLTR